MSSSEEDVDADLESHFHEIQRQRESLERETLKLGCLENRDARLELIRSIRFGEVEPTVIGIFRQTFQDKTRGVGKGG